MKLLFLLVLLTRNGAGDINASFVNTETLEQCDVNTPPAKAGGFGLRLKAGLIGHSADYRHTTVKSSSGSGGF
ncbi:MAG: hypothetical protein JMN25_09105 [gamma proteobacterium endosymbiont of Lamellibrachia anaximandri]|nr:hypothetical protein [gamma proteobacterium endosymbiont of Lamellibrachia anaximandri]